MGNTVQTQVQGIKDEIVSSKQDKNESQTANASQFSSVLNSTTTKDTTIYSPVTKFSSQERVNPFDKNNSTKHNEETSNKLNTIEDSVLANPNQYKTVPESDETVGINAVENISNIVESTSSSSNIIKSGPKLARQLSDADIIFGTSNKIMLPNRFTSDVDTISYQTTSNRNEYINL